MKSRVKAVEMEKLRSVHGVPRTDKVKNANVHERGVKEVLVQIVEETSVTEGHVERIIDETSSERGV